jgi:hypothetical protein
MGPLKIFAYEHNMVLAEVTASTLVLKRPT